jgi:glycosyltransferase involved in cell wall biosynthesis
VSDPSKTDSRPRPLVITDHGDAVNFFGFRTIVALKAAFWEKPCLKTGRFSVVSRVALGTKCWWTGLWHRESAAFVTSPTTGLVLAAFQYLASPLVRPRVHLIFDFLLERRRKGSWGAVDRLKMALIKRAVDLCIVWGHADIDAYAREHNLPRNRLLFHTFHITLENYEFEISDEGYIFAGGNYGRDYPTLLDALGPLDVPIFVATKLRGVKEYARRYHNVTVESLTPSEFRQKMACSHIVVVPHDKKLLRTGGHQTFLNAMWMGKAVVVGDINSAQGYIENGVNGVVVPAGSVEALRSCVQFLLENPAVVEELGAKARVTARQARFTTLSCMQSIYNLALGMVAEREGYDCKAYRISLYEGD